MYFKCGNCKEVHSARKWDSMTAKQCLLDIEDIYSCSGEDAHNAFFYCPSCEESNDFEHMTEVEHKTLNDEVVELEVVIKLEISEKNYLYEQLTTERVSDKLEASVSGTIPSCTVTDITTKEI